MNVCFKRIKKKAEVSLSAHKRKWEIYFVFPLTFLCVNFTAIKKECFNKNLFLKVSHHSPENTCVMNIFFYKVTGLQPSGFQNSRRETSVGDGVEISPAHFWKYKESALILQKRAPILGKCTLFVCIYGLKFSFKL